MTKGRENKLDKNGSHTWRRIHSLTWVLEKGVFLENSNEEQ